MDLKLQQDEEEETKYNRNTYRIAIKSIMKLSLLPLVFALVASTNAENLRGRELDEVDTCVGGYIKDFDVGEWLRPGQYLVEYGPDGEIEFKFGLNCNRLFGLWHNNELIWTPDADDGEDIRCDKLKFQESNGHLTCYDVINNDDGSYRTDHQWKSNCKDDDYPISGCSDLKRRRKINLVGGDVYQFDGAGQTVWRLPGSGYYTDEEIAPICQPSLEC